MNLWFGCRWRPDAEQNILFKEIGSGKVYALASGLLVSLL